VQYVFLWAWGRETQGPPRADHTLATPLLQPLENLFYIVEFVYNGFVCNINSPVTLHFVRARWHLLHAFQFAYNFNSAITFFILCHLARRLCDIMFFMGEKSPILQ